MTKLLMKLSAAIFCTLCTTAFVHASPSFDCSNAKLWYEQEVCSSNELSKIDIEINNFYNHLKKVLSDSELKQLEDD